MKKPEWLTILGERLGLGRAAADSGRAVLSGSEFIPLRGARRKWFTPADERIQVTVVLRPRTAVPDLSAPATMTAPARVRRPMTRKEFRRKHSASPDGLRKVEEFAHQHGLEVINRSGLRRRVLLAGPRSTMARAFGITFVHYVQDGRQHRGFKGAVQVPEELAEFVEAVLGLHDEPLARPRFPTAGQPGGKSGRLPATELTRLYSFPDADGAGQCIGVIALSGGYDKKDIESFFQSLDLPVPKITEVLVDDGFGDAPERGKNDPAPAEELAALADRMNGADVEVTSRAWDTLETTMDVELAGAFAPGADLVVYFAPNSAADGLYNTLMCILNDTVNEPAVISMSWGWPEYHHISTDALADPEVPDPVGAPLKIASMGLKDLVAVGVTVCVASGDDLARDDVGRPGVQFPASSPQVLACGGTTLEVSKGTIRSEKVWHEGEYASGGGVSRIFERPGWQAGLEVPYPPGCCHRGGRGVPDVAGVADGATGCRIVVGGHELSSAGTSAVAPLWAALITRIYAELNAESDYITPWLYRVRQEDPSVFRKIVESGNGFYQAVAGEPWNACTGLGSPVGDRLAQALGRAWRSGKTAVG